MFSMFFEKTESFLNDLRILYDNAFTQMMNKIAIKLVTGIKQYNVTIFPGSAVNLVIRKVVLASRAQIIVSIAKTMKMLFIPTVCKGFLIDQ